MADTPPKYEIPQQHYFVASYPIEIEKTEVITYKTKDHKIVKQIPSKLGYNCVQYAKSKAYVPQGMGSLKQKQNQIKTKIPKIGSVGITPEGPVGHLVIIEEIKGNTLIISEGNYRPGYITWREVDRSLITGYL